MPLNRRNGFIAFKITGAKTGWGISGTDKAGSNQPEEEKRRSPLQNSYIPALQQMPNVASKQPSKHNTDDKYHDIMRTASRRYTYRMRYGHCCWDLNNGFGCDKARYHRLLSGEGNGGERCAGTAAVVVVAAKEIFGGFGFWISCCGGAVKSSHSSVVSWDYFLFHAGGLKRIDKYLAVTSKTR
jgi:hypothetical protein